MISLMVPRPGSPKPEGLLLLAKTPQICIFNGNSNCFARTPRAFLIYVYFFVVLVKTSTWNAEIIRFTDNESTWPQFFSLSLALYLRLLQFILIPGDNKLVSKVIPP